jgi:uncharacterized protein YndB with AHSA1/START domain
MSEDMFIPPDVVYVTYIRATPQAVWDALTRAEHSARYFFGLAVEGDWRAGGAWALRKPDGAAQVGGEVLECDPPRRLKLSWRVALEGGVELSPAFISYDIAPAGEAVKLTMTQHQPKPIPRKFYDGGLEGWPKIIAGLKTYLETGAPLVIAPPPAPG